MGRAITCQMYCPPPGQRACKHFIDAGVAADSEGVEPDTQQDGGACRLPDVFMCTEWEKNTQKKVVGGVVLVRARR